MHSPVVHLLQKLIRIPSVNPDCSSDGAGEKAMADCVGEFLADVGFSVSQEEVLPGRPNVICRCRGSDKRPRILLCPHLDTVSIAGMDEDSFGVITEDKKILGRGASDTKGSVASMLQALSNCSDLLEQSPVAIDFVGFMGEEASQHGSKHFAEKHGQNYVFAIAGEPTDLNIVHVTKGSLWATLTSSGKAAHASQPERGENAILKLAQSLITLEQKLTPELKKYTHPELGHSTVNVGTVIGGKQPNIVPDHAAAQIDIRFTPSLHEEFNSETLLQRIIDSDDLPINIIHADANPPMEVSEDNPWIKKILTANPNSKPVGAPWFSDAAHLNAAGIPSVCIGPGSINQAHTIDEFITIDDLEAGVCFFENLIRYLSTS